MSPDLKQYTPFTLPGTSAALKALTMALIEKEADVQFATWAAPAANANADAAKGPRKAAKA